MKSYGRQWVDEADIDAVVDVLRSDRLTQGPTVAAFERAISSYCGAEHAVAVSSGTAALHLSCLALGLSPGDWLWTTPNTFAASANCARYCGADIDFVDIDIDTGNMSPVALAEKLRVAAANDQLPKIVVPVHYAGQPCDMDALAALGQEYGFRIIEDASHALGSVAKGTPVGGCRCSDATVFSLHPVKNITAGEGGVVTTNDIGLAERIRRLGNHGIRRDGSVGDGPWYYEQTELGFNYRLSDIHAALGLSQLRRLSAFVEKRRQLVSWYREALAGLPVEPLRESPADRTAWHLFVVRVSEGRDRRKQLFEHLQNNGIGTQVHYIPVHLHPYYQDLGFAPGDFPTAERFYEEALTLPLHPQLDSEDVAAVVNVLRQGLALEIPTAAYRRSAV